MRTAYIREINEKDDIFNLLQNGTNKKYKINLYKFISSFFYKIRNIFPIIFKTEEDNGKILMLISPLKKNTNAKILKKINKKIVEKYINKIVFSNNLLNNNEFMEIVEQKISKNVEILKGKNIFKYLSIDILNYIIETRNSKMPLEEVYILVNERTEENLYLLKEMVRNFKMVNIVTNKIADFKNFETKIFKEENILITVTNNKRKSLKKAKYILNLDFSSKELEKYLILRNSTIIQINKEAEYKVKSFNGIIIKDVIIDFKNKEEFEKLNKYFSTNVLYESTIKIKKEWDIIREKIAKEVKIKSIVGLNGEITKENIKQTNYE